MYKIDYIKNCLTRMQILLVSFLMYVIFHISPGLLLLEFNNTLLYQNEGGENSRKNINIHVPFYQSSVTPYLPSVKTIKILMSIRAFWHVRDIYTDQGLCIFLVPMLKTINLSFINSELVRTLYSVWLFSNLQWKQYIIIIVRL